MPPLTLSLPAVTVTTKIDAMSPKRVEFLADLITTAVEGGINYWSSVANYQWRAGPATTSVTVRDDEGGEGKAWHLDVEVIGAALEKLLTDPLACKVHVNNVKILWAASATNGEAEVPDAGAADLVVQVACFGEVIYG
jgi:hypothetical protein